MFAAFGSVIFQVLGSPESFEATRAYDYPEHGVVEDKPRLQFVAPGLETIALAMKFHRAFINPALALATLRAIADAHQAMPLVFGNGVFRGRFVIASITETHNQLADDGSLIAIEVKTELKEYAPGSEIDPFAPPKPDFTPIAIVPGPGSASGASGSSGVGTAVPSVASFSSPGVSALAAGGTPAPTSIVGNFRAVPGAEIVRAA